MSKSSSIDNIILMRYNRQFITEKYKLKSIINKQIPKHIQKQFEINDTLVYSHKEYYTNDNNDYICIFSGLYNETDENIILEKEYKLIEPIFNRWNDSYIKIINVV